MFEVATHPLTAALDTANADVGRAQRHMLRLIAGADRAEIWRHSGARDTAHLLAIRYGISEWKARRWSPLPTPSTTCR